MRCGLSDTGEVRTKVTDPEALDKIAKLIAKLNDKNTSLEMFRDFVRINYAKSNVKIDFKSFYKHKARQEDKLWTFNVLNQAIKLKSLRGFALHKAILEKIRLAKEMFLLEVNQGIEVAIPEELSQDNLPKSFQYYDSVLAII